MVSAKLWSDGGARGNPGPAGAGAYLKLADGREFRLSEYLGETTNNMAEYAGLKIGLQAALKQGVTEIECLMDSELLVKQLKGDYKVKAEHLKSPFNELQMLLGRFKKSIVRHIPREQNKIADALSNEAMDGGQPSSESEAEQTLFVFDSKPSTSQMSAMLQAHTDFIKLAVDIERRRVAGGGIYHVDCEKMLLEEGAHQQNIWGADWIPKTKEILFGAMVNIRPKDGNRSYELKDPSLRREIESIVRKIFEESR